MTTLLQPLFVNGIIQWSVGTFGEIGGALVLIILGIIALKVILTVLWLVVMIIFGLVAFALDR